MRAGTRQRFRQRFDQECAVQLSTISFVHFPLIYYTFNFDFQVGTTMQVKVIISGFLIVLGILTIGCGDSSTTNNAGNANAGNTNAANTNLAQANSILEPTKAPVATTTNDAPTLAPVVHAYYDALKRKDAGAVRKVMSLGFLQSTENDMKEEGKSDIIVALTEFDKLPPNKMEVRNEQITGNRGTAQLKGGSYIDWTTFVFVNEGGTWKISNEIAR